MGTVPVGGYLSSHTVAKSVWVWPSSGGMITPRDVGAVRDDLDRPGDRHHVGLLADEVALELAPHPHPLVEVPRRAQPVVEVVHQPVVVLAVGVGVLLVAAED